MGLFDGIWGRRRGESWVEASNRRYAEQHGAGDAAARVSIIAARSSDPPPASGFEDGPTNALWRFDGRRWERWSVVWREYEPDEAPGSLPAQLERDGVTPGPGDRWRLAAGGGWRRLGLDEPDQVPPGTEPTGADPDESPAPAPGEGDAPGSIDVRDQPVASASSTPEERDDPERPSTEEMLEAWRRARG